MAIYRILSNAKQEESALVTTKCQQAFW